MLNVPPTISSARILPSRARAINRAILAQCARASFCPVLEHRRHQPVSRATAMPMLTCSWMWIASPQRSVDVGELLERRRRRLDDQIVDRDSTTFRQQRVDLLAQVQRRFHVHFHRDVKVRRLLLAFPMRRAIVWRIGESGTAWYSSPLARPRDRDGAARLSVEQLALFHEFFNVALDDTAFRPLPATWRKSMPNSSAMRRATGEAITGLHARRPCWHGGRRRRSGGLGFFLDGRSAGCTPSATKSIGSSAVPSTRSACRWAHWYRPRQVSGAGRPV